jgi:hypothetical protein
VHTSCLACLERRHEAYAAHAGAAAIDQNAEQDAMDDREGVAMEPIVDDEFGDDSDMTPNGWTSISLGIPLFCHERKLCFTTCDSSWPTSRCSTYTAENQIGTCAEGVFLWPDFWWHFLVVHLSMVSFSLRSWIGNG